MKRAVGLIKEVENDWTEKCRVAKDALNEASAVVTAAKEKVDGLMNEKASLTSQEERLIGPIELLILMHSMNCWSVRVSL